jgi:hypothetical protein
LVNHAEIPIPASFEKPFDASSRQYETTFAARPTRMARSPAAGEARPWPFSQAQTDLRELLGLAASEGPQTIVFGGREFLVTAQPKATTADIDFLIGGGPLDDE